MKTARRELRATIDEVLDVVSLVETSVKLRPRLGQFLIWQNLDTQNKELIRIYLSSRVETNLCYEGLVVRLVATFEEYLRKLVRNAIKELNSRNLDYEGIQDGLRLHNRHAVGNALSSVFSPSDIEQFNFDQLCDEIGTCIPGRKVILSADAIASIKGSISVERLEK